MTRRSSTPDEVVQFAGLTSHNNVELSDKAAEAAIGDHSRDNGFYPDDMPDTSLATAIRGLERAEETGNAWKIPEQVARNIDVDELSDDTPDGVTFHETMDGKVFVQTDRFQSVISPDKLESWIQGDARRDDNNQWIDPLWHNPTKDYAIVNPLDFYGPLEESIREKELGNAVFGEIRTYKGGGEVHIEMLFDAFKIDNPGADPNVATDGGESGGPILLGIRTGYDYFGGTAMYAEGFAQDTWCSNSIRNVTDQKSRRHVGEPSETREWWDEILADMDLMTDKLAEVIETANQIDVDYLSFEFSELVGHTDDLQAWFEMAGFPSYLAREAASHVRSRADNQFLPTMWEMQSGATYAITHHYRGGENTSRLNELVSASNDMIMNPAQAIDRTENNAQQREARQRAAAEDEGELDAMSYGAAVEKFQATVEDQKEEFETRQEQLQEMLVAPAAANE